MAKSRGDDAAGAALRMLSTLGASQGYDVVERLVKSACSTHAEAYAVLYTLESRGLVEGRVEPSAEGGERRWYSLTERGHRALNGLRETVSGAVASLPGGVA